MTEDELVGWHQELDGHEIEQTLRVGPYRRLSTEELMLLNHGVGEDS